MNRRGKREYIKTDATSVGARETTRILGRMVERNGEWEEFWPDFLTEFFLDTTQLT
jgi:hypothetical protein